MVMKKQTLEDRLEAVLDDNVNHPAHYTYGSIEVIGVSREPERSTIVSMVC